MEEKVIIETNKTYKDLVREGIFGVLTFIGAYILILLVVLLKIGNSIVTTKEYLPVVYFLLLIIFLGTLIWSSKHLVRLFYLMKYDIKLTETSIVIVDKNKGICDKYAYSDTIEFSNEDKFGNAGNYINVKTEYKDYLISGLQNGVVENIIKKFDSIRSKITKEKSEELRSIEYKIIDKKDSILDLFFRFVVTELLSCLFISVMLNGIGILNKLILGTIICICIVFIMNSKLILNLNKKKYIEVKEDKIVIPENDFSGKTQEIYFKELLSVKNSFIKKRINRNWWKLERIELKTNIKEYYILKKYIKNRIIFNDIQYVLEEKFKRYSENRM